MGQATKFMRFIAAWALVHETADEGWKAAVERGSGQARARWIRPRAFVDGLSAMIAEEKERLKAELAAGRWPRRVRSRPKQELDELRFEVAEIRGRLESMQASLDARTPPERGRAPV